MCWSISKSALRNTPTHTSVTRSWYTMLTIPLQGDWECEGFDRPHLDLPGNTARLITEVLKANPKTVIVTQSGTPITMTPWSTLSTTHLHMW